jgi:hypothetical protein
MAGKSTGRPPKPTRLKVLQGNPGHRALNTSEPQPDAADLNPPRWLKASGRRVWREYAPKLQGLGLLTQMDVETFAQACALSAEARVLKPGSADHIRAVEAAGRILARFGFTPSDRARLSVTKPASDPFSDFLSRKQAT